MNSSNVRSSSWNIPVSLHTPLLPANERDSSSIPRDSIFGSSSSSEGQEMTVLENSSSSASTSSSEKSLTPSSEDKVRGVARKLLFEEDAPEEINYKEEPPTEGDSTDVNEAAPAQGWCSYLFGKVKSCASAAIDAVGQFWKSRDPCVKETLCCVAGCGTAVAAGFSAPGSWGVNGQTRSRYLQCSTFFTGLFCQSAVNVRGWDESADNTEDTTKPLCERKIAEELIRQEATLRRYGHIEHHGDATASAGAPDRLPPVANYEGDGQLISEGDADVEMQSALIAKDEQQADQASGWGWGCCSPLPPPADGLLEYPNMPRNCYELGMSILEKLGDCKERPWIELKRAWLWLIEYKPTELVWTLDSLVFLVAYFRQGEIFTASALATILTAGAGVHLANILHGMANRANQPEPQKMTNESVGCCDLIKRVVSSCGKAIKECGKGFALRAAALAAVLAAGIYLTVTNFSATEGLYTSEDMLFGAVGTVMTAAVPAYLISKLIACSSRPCLDSCSQHHQSIITSCAQKMPLLLAAVGNAVLSGASWNSVPGTYPQNSLKGINSVSTVMGMGRFVGLSDAAWALIERELPAREARRGRPNPDFRTVFN